MQRPPTPQFPIPIPQSPFLYLQLKVYMCDDFDDLYRRLTASSKQCYSGKCHRRMITPPRWLRPGGSVTSIMQRPPIPQSPFPNPQPPFLNLQLKVYVGDDADDRYRHRKELMAAHITGTPPPVAWDPKALRRLASKVPS